MQGKGVLERVHSLLAVLLVVSMIATPAMTYAQDDDVATPTSTESVEPTAEAETPPVDNGDEGEFSEPTEPVEDTEVPTEEAEPTEEVATVEAETPVVDNNNNTHGEDAPAQKSVDSNMQQGLTSQVTLSLSSSDPSIEAMSPGSYWTISTVSNGAQRYFSESIGFQLPQDYYTTAWLGSVPYGDGVAVTVYGGPQFELWTGVVDINAPQITIPVEFQPIAPEEISEGNFLFNISTSDGGRLPAASRMTVHSESTGERIFLRSGIQPNQYLAPARSDAPAPYGDYRVVITPPSGYQTIERVITLGSPLQVVDLQLVAIGDFTGTVTVEEPTTLSTRPLADATVTLSSGEVLTTDAAGSAEFTALGNGSYAVSVVAADGRTGTGTLTIADANGSVTIVLDVIAANLTVTVDVCPELPSTLVAGDSVVINYTVTNDGNVNMVNSRGRVFKQSTRQYYYASSDQIPNPLAPGESATVTVNYRLDEAEIAAGHLNANASVSSTRPPFGQNTSFSAPLNDCLIDQADTFTGTVVVEEPTTISTRPLADATVTLDTGAELTTAANGSAVFADIATGEYAVSVVAADGRTGAGTLTIADADGSVTILLDAVAAQMTVHFTECPELPSTLLADDLVVITFTVENTGNVNMTSASARVFKTQGRQFFYSNPAIQKDLAPGETAQATINYRIDQTEIEAGHLRGTAYVSATNPSGWNTSWSTPINDCLIDQAETYTGSVLVVEADGETPVPDASVSLEGVELPGTTGTDGTANFTELVDGTYPVTVDAVDGRTASGTLEIAGENGNVTVTLPAVVTQLTLGDVCPDLSGQLRIGDDVNFHFTVTNTGNVNIVNMRGSVYQDETGTRIDSNPPIPGTLAPGETAEIFVVYTLGGEDADRGGINGTAQAAGDRPNGTRIVASSRTLPCTFEPFEDFTAVASADCPEDISAIEVGDEIEFELVITNVGDTSIHTPQVTTNREEAVGRQLTLGRGNSRIVTYTTVVTEEDLESGILNASFSVTPGRPKTNPAVVRTSEANCIVSQQPEMSAVSVDVSSAEESVAKTLPAGASWTVTQGEAVIESGVFAEGNLELPNSFALTSQIEFGEYELSIDAGPNFEPLTAFPLVVNQEVQTFAVELNPVRESSVTVNVVSADAAVANVLPADATWTVSYDGQEIAGGTFAAEHLQLPAEIVVDNAVPFGTYMISIDAGPNFEPLTSHALVVNQQEQTFVVELQPVRAVEETHTGTVQVVEADTTTPVVGAEVFIYGNDDNDDAIVQIPVIGLQSAGGGIEWGTPLASGLTGETGAADFAGLANGEYSVAVVAQDGRTATGTLSINGADSASLIVMQAVPDPTDPETPDPSDPSTPDAEDDVTVTDLPETGLGTGNTSATMMLLASAAAAVMAASGLILRKNQSI